MVSWASASSPSGLPSDRRFPSIDRHLQGARIGEADVLHGHAGQAARKIARVAPPSNIRASQYSAASGFELRTHLCSAEIWS
jgi:hypothetical protein